MDREMKSWTLSRNSSKKDKKEKSSPDRPKSMIMNMPGASGSTELITSIQASPSLSYTSKEKTSPSNISIRGKKGDGSPISAKRYLNSAQLKDQARREDLGPIKTAAISSPSSRAPLSVKENEQQHDQEHSKRNLTPSLIKSPFHSSPTPSTVVSSSTAAIAYGNASSQQGQDQQTQSQLDHHSHRHLEYGTSMSESGSMASLQLPPSPSRQPLNNFSPPRTRLTSIKSDLPSRKEVSRIPKLSKDKMKSILSNKKEQNEDQASAIASLRRLKESDDSATIDASQHDHIDSTSVIDSQGSIEEVKEQGRPFEIESAEDNPPVQKTDLESKQESKQQEATLEQKHEEMNNVESTKKGKEEEGEKPDEKKNSKLTANSAGSTSYTYAIRKINKEKASSLMSPKEEEQQKMARRVEAKVNLAIVTQRQSQIAARYIISTPIPALLAFDYLASWTVERAARITSCFIDIFGS